MKRLEAEVVAVLALVPTEELNGFRLALRQPETPALHGAALELDDYTGIARCPVRRHGGRGE